MLLFIILTLGVHHLCAWREVADMRSSLASALFIGSGIGLAVWAWSLFVADRTTLIPANPVNIEMVVQGPYRFSRNPMYLAVVMIGLG
jgi:protein-S-isoprenylcysteine O-methyltransferase Ste14